MHSNQPSKGKWPSSRAPDNVSAQGYGAYGVDRNDSGSFHTPTSPFNANQPPGSDGGRMNTAVAGRPLQGPPRPRYADNHGNSAGSGVAVPSPGAPFQHNLPAPRHASGGSAAEGSGITLPPPRSAQIMAANGTSAGPPYVVRSGNASSTAGRWSAVAATPPSHPQMQTPVLTAGVSSPIAGGSLYTRMADASAAKAGPRDAAALSYAVSDGGGMLGAATLGSPGNLNSIPNSASRNENLAEISALLQQVDDDNDQLVGSRNQPFTEPARAEGRFDGGARREASAFTFTTSSEFSTALFPSGMGASTGGGVTTLSTVPNAFSTRPDASGTASFHSPFSTATAAAAPPAGTSLFSLLANGNEEYQGSHSGGGPVHRQQLPTGGAAATPSFTTNVAPLQQPHSTGQGLFPNVTFQHSDGGESSEGEGLLDFRAVLGSPSAEPEDSVAPATAFTPIVEHATQHSDPTVATSPGPKPTMAETLFKHASKPTNPAPAVDAPAKAESATEAKPAVDVVPSATAAKPSTPLTKPATTSSPGHPEAHERPAVPAPRSAERTGVTSAPRSPQMTSASRPQRLPLESPTVTRHNIARLFRDSPQSQRHREVMQQNRVKPTALHRQSQWPPTNPAEVEALLKKANAGKLLRHLAIICFSRQNVKGVQELFDTWTRNGIPAPDLGFGAYYYYVKERSEKLLCMKHNGRGAIPGHGYGKCDFESRRPNSTCRYEHVCLFCRSREHGWFEESRCEGYQQLLAEVERLGVSEDDLEVMLDAMEKPATKQASWNRQT